MAKCIAVGLVGSKALSVDASLIRADVDKNKRMPGDRPIDWPKPEEASRTVREYLAALDNARRNEEDETDEHQQMIRALAPDRANQAFERIHSRDRVGWDKGGEAD